MTYRSKAIISIIIGVFLLQTGVFGALDTTEIEKIAKKTVLEKPDLAVIDQFVEKGVSEIVGTEDFSSIASTRATMAAFNHSTQASADIQYKPEFSAASLKSLTNGFEAAKKIDDVNRQAKVNLNLMILLDSMNDPALVNLALSMADTEDAAIRYWAIHAVTNANIAAQLNKPDGRATVQVITAKLVERIKSESSPEIIEQIAAFSTSVNSSEAQKLLVDIADARIKKYEAGAVDSALVDGTVLKQLSDKANAGQDGDLLSPRFGQLLAYVMQLYMDKNTAGALHEQLGAVMVQAESKSLSKFGIAQTSIKRALDKNTPSLIATEYKLLFGDGATAGKLNINYGQDAAGAKITAPKKLAVKTDVKTAADANSK